MSNVFVCIQDTLALQFNSIKQGQRILLVDDFLATGGIKNLLLKAILYIYS